MSNFYLRQGKNLVETGELREQIEICKHEMVLDRKTGIQIPAYKTIKETRAKIIGESGREFLKADREVTQLKKRCFLRNRRDMTIDESFFIRHKGKLFNIYEAIPLDSMFLELRLEQLQDDSI